MKRDRIGKYEIVGKIGQGAMGEVFRGHDPVLNRPVAIKTISAGLDADETMRRRFQREAQSAAQLSHPNIITVYELGLEGDHLFMAMELLEGVDLKHALAQRTMPFGERLDVMEQICEGLAYAHAHGIVHRDLKPANIHLLPGGKVKIMDFGLARLSGSDMTRTGMVMGTPHYMAPEQVRGSRADARSDIFALGCVFYEVLTGRKPFDAESMHAVLYKVIQEEPVPAGEVAPGLPAVLLQVVDKALAKDPAERFPSAGEMLAALRRARQAIGAGRGHERVQELERTPASPATREPARTQGRPATERSASAPAVRSHSHPSMARGRRAMPIALGLVVLAVIGGAYALRWYVLDGQGSGPAAPAEVQHLAQAVTDNQVELARRRLDARDFADAARLAERALRLAPNNAAAKAVLEEARSALQRIEAAAAAVRDATVVADPARRAAAVFDLMQLDPAHPEAEKAARELGEAYRARTNDARGMMERSRRAAEEAGASRLPAYQDGIALARQGDRTLQDGQVAVAARRFLEAREQFERSRRAAR